MSKSFTITVDDSDAEKFLNSGRPGFGSGVSVNLIRFRRLFKLPDDAPIDMSQIKVDIYNDRLWVTMAEGKTPAPAEAIAA